MAKIFSFSKCCFSPSNGKRKEKDGEGSELVAERKNQFSDFCKRIEELREMFNTFQQKVRIGFENDDRMNNLLPKLMKENEVLNRLEILCSFKGFEIFNEKIEFWMEKECDLMKNIQQLTTMFEEGDSQETPCEEKVMEEQEHHFDGLDESLVNNNSNTGGLGQKKNASPLRSGSEARASSGEENVSAFEEPEVAHEFKGVGGFLGDVNSSSGVVGQESEVPGEKKSMDVQDSELQYHSQGLGEFIVINNSSTGGLREVQIASPERSGSKARASTDEENVSAFEKPEMAHEFKGVGGFLGDVNSSIGVVGQESEVPGEKKSMDPGEKKSMDVQDSELQYYFQGLDGFVVNNNSSTGGLREEQIASPQRSGSEARASTDEENDSALEEPEVDHEFKGVGGFLGDVNSSTGVVGQESEVPGEEKVMKVQDSELQHHFEGSGKSVDGSSCIGVEGQETEVPEADDWIEVEQECRYLDDYELV